MRKRTVHILTDILGILAMLVAPLLGPLPGPGGIPLFLAGLSLLALNHEWARHLLEKLKKEGLKFMDNIFKDNPRWQAGVDIIGLLVIVLALWLFLYPGASSLYVRVFGVGLLLGGTAALLVNRDRIDKILKIFKAKAK